MPHHIANQHAYTALTYGEYFEAVARYTCGGQVNMVELGFACAAAAAASVANRVIMIRFMIYLSVFVSISAVWDYNIVY